MKSSGEQDQRNAERDQKQLAISQAQLELAERREERELRILEAREAREAEDLLLRQHAEERRQREEAEKVAEKTLQRAMELAKHPLPKFQAIGERMLEKLMSEGTI